MDIGLHHVTEGVIDQAMPLDEWFVLKCIRNYVYDEMATAASGAGVSGMLGAVVDNFQGFGLQGRRQTLVNPLNAFSGHIREVPS